MAATRVTYAVYEPTWVCIQSDLRSLLQDLSWKYCVCLCSLASSSIGCTLPLYLPITGSSSPKFPPRHTRSWTPRPLVRPVRIMGISGVGSYAKAWVTTSLHEISII